MAGPNFSGLGPLVIDSASASYFLNGSVGIGTNAPAALLNLKGTSGTPTAMVLSSQGAGYGPAFLTLTRRGASDAATPNNAVVGEIRFDGVKSGGGYDNFATILGEIGTNATGGAPGHLVFSTSPSGAVSPSERMRINPDGNVGIGTNVPSQKLSVNGVVGVWSGNEVNFYTDAGVTLKGFVGAGRNNDLSLVSKTASWLRIGANNQRIAFFPDNTGDTGDTPKAYFDTDGSLWFGSPARKAIDAQGRALYA